MSIFVLAACVLSTALDSEPALPAPHEIVAQEDAPATPQTERVATPAPDEEKPPIPRALKVTLGYGLTLLSDSDLDVQGTGFLVGGELAWMTSAWFTPRIYAGLLMTNPDESSCPAGFAPCQVSSKVAFAGAKARLAIPIPYIEPFLELGLGVSVGALRTRVGALYDVDESGVFYHFPFALGLALGERHEFEVAYSYLFHPDQHQVGGAVAISFQFPS